MSLATLIAQNATHAAYPNLWKGLKIAYCPSLGPSSAFQNYALRKIPTGTFIGSPPFVPTKRGYALDLDGTTQYVDCGDTAIFDSDPCTSVAVWAWPDEKTNANFGLATKWTTDFVGFRLVYENGGGVTTYKFSIGNNFGTSVTAFSNTAISDLTDRWHLFSASANASGATLFLDGRQVATASANYTAFTNTAVNLYFGADENVATNYRLDGRLGDCFMWNRALTASEMAMLYAGAHPLIPRDTFGTDNSEAPIRATARSWRMMMGIGA